MYRVDFLESCEIIRDDGNKKYKFPKGFSLFVSSANRNGDRIDIFLKDPIILDYHWYIPLNHAAERTKITYTRSVSRPRAGIT
jgi:hypothetical protein